MIVAGGVLAIDAKPGLSASYRTRVRPFDRIIVPRYLVTAGLASASYVLGAFGAWYETPCSSAPRSTFVRQAAAETTAGWGPTISTGTGEFAASAVAVLPTMDFESPLPRLPTARM